VFPGVKPEAFTVLVPGDILPSQPKLVTVPEQVPVEEKIKN
jgi:hypothetical protein